MILPQGSLSVFGGVLNRSQLHFPFVLGIADITGQRARLSSTGIFLPALTPVILLRLRKMVSDEIKLLTGVGEVLANFGFGPFGIGIWVNIRRQNWFRSGPYWISSIIRVTTCNNVIGACNEPLQRPRNTVQLAYCNYTATAFCGIREDVKTLRKT